jgi:hypothetical protein
VPPFRNLCAPNAKHSKSETTLAVVDERRRRPVPQNLPDVGRIRIREQIVGDRTPAHTRAEDVDAERLFLREAVPDAECEVLRVGVRVDRAHRVGERCIRAQRHVSIQLQKQIERGAALYDGLIQAIVRRLVGQAADDIVFEVPEGLSPAGQPLTCGLSCGKDSQVIHFDFVESAAESDGARRAHDSASHSELPELVQYRTGLTRAEVEERRRQIGRIEQCGSDPGRQARLDHAGCVLGLDHERFTRHAFYESDAALLDVRQAH